MKYHKAEKGVDPATYICNEWQKFFNMGLYGLKTFRKATKRGNPAWNKGKGEIELIWAKWSWADFRMVAMIWVELSGEELSFVESGWVEIGCAELGWMEWI